MMYNQKSTDLMLEITSNDSFKLNMPTSYKLVKPAVNKADKIANGFKNSILGRDIGINSEGFSYIAILSTILAIGTIIAMYIFWRI